MRIVALVGIVATALVSTVEAQTNARLIRYADVSATQIAFVYGGDIWLVAKEGGTAMQVTHSPGEESWPRFSPDGSEIAFTAAYRGNEDVYVMPVNGGVPTRVTYQSHADRMVDWHPDGERVLFASGRESGRQSFSQLYLVSKTGGLPEKLSVPYAELASFSPSGDRLAYITKITENYPFKRYEGGLASDVILFDLRDDSAVNITNNRVNDGKPAWVGDDVYFLSDQGDEVRLNLWRYDTQSSTTEQVTTFTDFDISLMAAGPEDLVFEAGGQLYRMDLETESYERVDVEVVSDLSSSMARTVDVSGRVSNMTAAPGGNRVVFEARGELFDVPASDGFVLNLTRSSGAFDRDPAWSPDGHSIAFWSDRSGEYEIYLQATDPGAEARRLTNRGEGFGYRLYWSPDSEMLAFIDETNDISVVDVASGDVRVAGNTDWTLSHPGRLGYPISWSPDSRWIAFTQGVGNGNTAVFLYDVEARASHQVTSGFYQDSNPVFGSEGDYLFYFTGREFSAAYSALGDGTWVYPNTTRIAAVGLRSDIPSLLPVSNDEAEVSGKEEDTEVEDEDDVSSEIGAPNGGGDIDLDGFEARLELLPPRAGNLSTLMAFGEKLVYRRGPNTGAGGGPTQLMVYDFQEREEETVLPNVGNVVPTADGESLLASSGGKYGIVQPQPGQSIDDPIATEGLVVDLVPREEWRQIFDDTWRRHRDFFYDANMHGVDWDDLRQRYGALIDDARTRWDVLFVQSQLAAELSAGHTYARGGDTERVASEENGYLGIDWALDERGYRVERIVRPASWDTEVRSPLDRRALGVEVGMYIHSVNGISLDVTRDPYAAFEGLAGQTVTLSVSETGDRSDARSILIETLTTGEEVNLRYLEWIEDNRRMVEELSGGRLGYIYMSNTAGRGQLELVKMFYGQLDKEGFVIDERFNGGGALADRFLELLQRPVVYNLHYRYGRDHTQPSKTNAGPMGMLINGWAGSGGDALPWAFQELEAGPIVGERTLGILVGPATPHVLIDGGSITVPGARLYDNDGHWFWEGQGVEPDIEVWDDPNLLVQGRDPQIERVVQEVLELVRTQPAVMTPAPELEDRSGRSRGRGPGG